MISHYLVKGTDRAENSIGVFETFAFVVKAQSPERAKQAVISSRYLLKRDHVLIREVFSIEELKERTQKALERRFGHGANGYSFKIARFNGCSVPTYRIEDLESGSYIEVVQYPGLKRLLVVAERDFPVGSLP